MPCKRSSPANCGQIATLPVFSVFTVLGHALGKATIELKES